MGALQLIFQAANPASFFQFDDIFWVSVLIVFGGTVIGAMVSQRRRDKCLQLFDDFHTTYIGGGGEVLWGDLTVLSQGIEVSFDAPFTNRRGITKGSSLIYDDELQKCRALCRVDYGLTEEEKKVRKKQIVATFRPNIFRRLLRSIRNVINTLKDAITKSMMLVVGRVGGSAPLGAALKQQTGQISELGQTIVGEVGNSYEPLLERHIGRPVVLELRPPDGDKSGIGVAELPGYLVDYSNRFVALFNIDHSPIERFELDLEETTSRPGVEIELQSDHVIISASSADAIVVRKLVDGDKETDLAVVIAPGAKLRLRRRGTDAVRLELERTRAIDVICPRSLARIRFGSHEDDTVSRRGWKGGSPQALGAASDA